MNKKGFTLTEILGAIIILGLLAVIAVVTFTGSMREFREDYYTDTVRTLTESGKEFFNDNRKYRPSEILGAQIVPLNTLVAQHYIDDVKDYKGNSCSNSSYVIVIKNGKDDYTYHACLVCSGDDYSNMNDKYCDSAWTNGGTVEYSITAPPELYVYKGTPKSSLKDELAIKASYVKKNSKGEVLGVVDGTGFDDAPTIYPDNFDHVNTNVLGLYELKYRYQEQAVTGHVTVYEYIEPGITIEKENTVIKALPRTEEIKRTAYGANDWAQKIYITMTKGRPYAGENVDISTANLKNIVHQYQWNKDGIWQNFCPGDNCSNIEVTTEMNENIKFRSIDINGIVSEETSERTIRIDNTKPTCTIVSTGPDKGKGWFTGNVTVSFTNKTDLVGSKSEAVSELTVYNIIEAGNALKRENKASVPHTLDTGNPGVTYYGLVEDKAQNYYVCEVFFKKDATDPACRLSRDGDHEEGNTEWFNGESVAIWMSTKDNHDDRSATSTTYSSDIAVTRITGHGNEKSDFITDPVDSESKTNTIIHYDGYIEDAAGNSATCSTEYRKDSVKPSCELITTGTVGKNKWYTGTVTISFVSSKTYDELSDIRSYGIESYTGEHSIPHTLDTGVSGKTYTGYIIDNAGNSKTCPVSFKKDGTPPACVLSRDGDHEEGNTTWFNGESVAIWFTTKDNYDDRGNGSITYSSPLVITKITGHGKEDKDRIIDPVDSDSTANPIIHYDGYIEDEAGNNATCSTEYRKDSVKPSCELITTGTEGKNKWYTGTVTISFVDAKTYDNLSDIRSYGIESYTGEHSIPHTLDTGVAGKTYTGYIVDNAGNTKTCPVSFKKDGTAPSCALSRDGDHEAGNTTWFNGESVTIWFSTKDNHDDRSATSITYSSPLAVTKITGHGKEDKDYIIDSADSDSSSKPVIHYDGYIEDEAGNNATCSTEYRKDSVKPSCELVLDGNLDKSGWYNSKTVGVSFNAEKTKDTLSGIRNNGLGSYTGNKTATQKENTTGVTYTGYIIDNAGNSVTCPVNFKKDDATEAIEGGCFAEGNDEWKKANEIALKHGLNVQPISECVSSSGTGYSYTNGCVLNYKTAVPSGTAVSTRDVGGATFYSKSGIAIKCPSYEEHVYIDLEQPECTSSGGSEGWGNTDITLIGTCDDKEGSGCVSDVSLPFESNTERYNVSPGTVYDQVGNSKSCPSNQNVLIDKTAPTCTSTTSNSNWTNTSVTVTGTCSDKGGSGCTNDTKTVTNTISSQTNDDYSPGTVYDNAGNSADCDSLTVKIDLTAPTCTSSSSSTTGWTNGSVTVTGTCSDEGGSECAGDAVKVFSDQQNGTPSPGKVYDNAGNESAEDCPGSSVQIDTTAPTCGTTTCGDYSLTGVSVSIECSDEGGSGCSGGTATATTSGSITLTDGANNSVTCDYSVSSYTENSTRSYDTCLTGSPNQCVGGNVTTIPKTGYCCKCLSDSTWENSWTAGPGTPSGCRDCITCSSGDCSGCSTTKWDNCASTKNTCEEGWTDWTDYSSGGCLYDNTDTWECYEQTWYYCP